MTLAQQAMFTEMRRLLAEAYAHYFKYGEGGHKSSEGYVEVYYPNIFKVGEYTSLRASGLAVYSYVLGPSRMHSFDTFEEALATVRKWHSDELDFDDEMAASRSDASKPVPLDEYAPAVVDEEGM